MLNNIQQLRGIAALTVLAAHALQSAQKRAFGDSRFLIDGELGVELFFVISGFIMIYTTYKRFGQPGAVREFWLRRLIRIVPLYWAFSVVMFVLLQASKRPPSFSELGLSLAFIPYDVTDGSFRPVLGVGWSLDYEMMFYLIFGLALAFSRRIGIAFVCLTLFGLVCGHLLEPTGVLDAWTHPRLLLFIFGIAAGLAFLRTEKNLPARKVSLQPAAFVIVGLLLATHAANTFLDAGIPRFVFWLGAGTVVWIAELNDPARKVSGFSSWLATMGDRSYSLYLVHIIVLFIVAKISDTLLGSRLGLGAALLYVAVIAGISLVLARLSFEYFEKPVTKWLNCRFTSSR